MSVAREALLWWPLWIALPSGSPAAAGSPASTLYVRNGSLTTLGCAQWFIAHTGSGG